MQVKRFLAADMRRALEMVRQELGPDAVILSSNRTKDGVELLTTRATPAMPEIPTEATASNSDAGEAFPQTGRERAAAIEHARRRQLAQRDIEDSAREFLQPNQTVNAGIPMRRSSATARREAEVPSGFGRAISAAERYPLRDEPRAARPERQTYSEPDTHDHSAASGPQLKELQVELAEMRLLLEEQLSQVMVGRESPKPPALASVGRRLTRMGLPPEVVDTLLEDVAESSPLARGWSEALARLARQLPVDAIDRVDRGGLFALVGPTGAGKTTSIGKLAARYVMAHGPREVALVTLDTHRIGGHDQLRSLARILGITLKVVDDSQSLDTVLYSLRRCSLVLIDTAGFRHGDPCLAEQMEMLELQPKIQKLLVLPCNSQEAMLKASLHAYGGAGVKGCILTKLDESASLGEALGVVMQSGVPIVYTTHGQDIPRDLDVARAHQLVARAASLINQRDAGGRQVDTIRRSEQASQPRFRAV